MVAEDVMALTFSVDGWQQHRAGQHYDIRLTAPSGYQAERSYSVASPPEQKGVVEFGVQLLQSGEVSPYLFALKPGEQVELRGPIGGHFIWDVSMKSPLVLIGGGSGMVPLMSMIRHHLKNIDRDKEREIIFLISARTLGHVLYKEELEKIVKENPHVKIVQTLTDARPEGWNGYKRRIDAGMFKEVLGSLLLKMPCIYICGPTKFVEVAANLCVEMGENSHSIHTERFGG